MKINQLRYFVSVCKTGSFISASKNMFVSQPAIAQAIKDLETEFNVQLFERNNNKLTLTDDGKWLLEKAEDLIIACDNLEKELHLRSVSRNYIKIGVAPMFGNLYFYEKLNAFRKDNPDIRIDVEEAGSVEIKKWILLNTVDIGVCVLNSLKTEKIAVQKIMDVELKFCVHKDNPLAKKKTLEFSDLENIKICLLKKDSYQNAFVQQKLDEAGVKYDVMMYSSQLSSITTMLCSSDCGAFLFGDSQKYNPSIVAIPMRQPLYLTIGFVWNPRQMQYPQTGNFRKFMLQQFKDK